MSQYARKSSLHILLLYFFRQIKETKYEGGIARERSITPPKRLWRSGWGLMENDIRHYI